MIAFSNKVAIRLTSTICKGDEYNRGRHSKQKNMKMNHRHKSQLRVLLLNMQKSTLVTITVHEKNQRRCLVYNAYDDIPFNL